MRDTRFRWHNFVQQVFSVTSYTVLGHTVSLYNCFLFIRISEAKNQRKNNGANILVNNYIEYYHFALYYITVIISEFCCQTIITAVMEPQLRL